MSIPNALFVSSRENALAYVVNGNNDVPGLFEFGGITDLDISNLFSLATGEEFDFDKHELLPLNDEQGQNLFELPDRFINVLSARSSSDAHELATQWSRTEELNCDPGGLVPIVEHLLKLSKAVGSNNVYFTQG
ncbi:hypothetical protein [Luteimonas salinilitoris]|uniref:Uncharacterized protein n=1 Tax=Luteimonas salinilitoris TaxID=3237697 RepID=A0ABV4HVY6_9GAMM